MVEEEHLLYLDQLEEQHHDALLANERHQKCIKLQYGKSIQPHIFFKGDLVLVYDQKHDQISEGNLETIWFDPYIVKHILKKGACVLIEYDENTLTEPYNGLYVK